MALNKPVDMKILSGRAAEGAIQQDLVSGLVRDKLLDELLDNHGVLFFRKEAGWEVPEPALSKGR